ncbi:M20 family metallopeptidase [Pseudooceanicola aestuarii]|uniref:M20 family metallopeptidase n=1 Tax=Pseudooceanicola aestuarii TaxID=2697319 RepID=UPI0013D02EF1|nr:M20 family metallopeptidase [Pseudooceanicola aestuarii]
MSSREQAVAAAQGLVDSGAFVEILRGRIAIPTESQEPDRHADLHRYLTDQITPALADMGFDSRILPNPEPGGGPFLIGTRIEDPALPTVLTYGHGDVVRGIPEQWREGLDPWTVAVEGDRWYGRGTADNKGQHALVLAALNEVLKVRGRLGFNVKVLIETSEEIGSTGLDQLLETEAQALAADVLIASDGPRLVVERPDVKLGNRGSVTFDMHLTLREGSRHSGHWGGVLEDPAIILAQALSCITSPRGEILIEDWLPRDIPPRIRAAIRDIRVDPSDPSLIMPEDWGQPGLTTPEKMYGWTSFIVLAMLSGRPENPVNGVQPAARARCQIRHTVDADAQKFMPALRRHLDAHGFDMVEVEELPGNRFPPWRTDPDDPWVEEVLASLTRTRGERPILMPNSSGGLPSEIFARHLGCPVIWIPHSYGGCRQHGPDEHMLAPIVREGLGLMAGLFWDIGERGTK